MNTIKIFLAESGRVADLHKDFPLYQHQYQNKLLNVYVPTSILAPEFTTLSDEGQTLNEYVAGTAVKIGMRYLTRSGEIKVSESRYMRYLKTLTYQGVEYALFERKLPKEFTLYAGQGQNAPVLIINVVNIETDTDPSEILSLIPSQSCSLDVMPSSNLDNDETIEPSEVDTINARLNAIDETLAEKQDKVDESINLTTDEDDNITWQDSHSVVGSINNNTQQNEINKSNIATNTSDIATIQGDIAYLYAHLSQPEEYIGQMEGSSLPTNSQLTNFVEETVEREPKNADVIIFILQIAGETDKNYKYIYAVDGWNGYEIPPLEEASNGSLGLIEGTYNVGSTNDTLVDISGGKIANIYVKDGTNTYRNIREYLNTTTTNIANIVNGSTSVGKALTAIADELGNNIVNTYLTQSAGATKDFVRNYALPRTFNDIFFIYRDPNDVNKGTYGGDVPSQTQQFTKSTSAVGDFTICELTMGNILQRKFELSRKNSCQNSFWVTANRNCVVTFRLTTQVKLAGEDYVDLAVELTSPISITAGSLQRVDITSVFSYLNDTVINFSSLSDMIKQTLEVITQESTSTTFSVYSSETYPSTFNLNTTSLVIYNTLGKLGEQPVYELTPSGAITSSGVDLVGSDTAQIYNNTECYLKITIPMDTEGYSDYFGENCYIHSITLGGDSIRLATPYNYLYGQPRFSDLKQVIHYFTDPVAAYYMMKCFIQIDSGDNITFIVDEDNVSGKLDKSSETNKVYGTDGSGNQTMIGYDTTPTGNIARRDTNSQLSVPLTPTANEHSTSKKYVDDNIATREKVLNEESHTIQTTDWQDLSSSEPYKFSATITATYTIGNDTEVGTINDQPVLFGNYGFVVGALNGQSVTIYAVKKPETSVTLLIGFRG